MKCPHCKGDLAITTVVFHFPFVGAHAFMDPATGGWRTKDWKQYDPELLVTSPRCWPWLYHEVAGCGKKIPLRMYCDGDDLVMVPVEGLEADDILMEDIL